MEWQAFIGIIAIIGIVVVVGGLIAFLGHIIIGAFDNEDRVQKQPQQEVMDYSQYKQQTLINEQTKQQDYDFEAINMAKAEKERAMVEGNKEEDLFKLVEENDSNLEEIENRLKGERVGQESKVNDEKPATDVKTLEDAPMAVSEPDLTKNDEESADEFDIQNLIDEINNEVVDEEKEKVEAQPEEINSILAEYDINKILDKSDTEDEDVEEEKTTVEEHEQTEVLNEESVETDEAEHEDEQNEAVEENTQSVEDEKRKQELEDANKRIAELTSKLEDLNKQLSEQSAQPVEVVAIDMTEEECLNRISVLEERLKNAKKDYKINMKEYRPLKKVMNDLERYQTKLRRKEAIVAKKKVALYGVNNYVDIDKEKAEKLANELELLDGLRLSVNHCEDVINANKDRFPILEHTNNILEEQIAQLEADLEQTNVTLQKIREREGKGNGENNQ